MQNIRIINKLQTPRMTDVNNQIQRRTIFSKSAQRTDNKKLTKDELPNRSVSRTQKKTVYVSKSSNNFVYKFIQFPTQTIQKKSTQAQKNQTKKKKNIVKLLLQDLPQMKTSSIFRPTNLDAHNEMKQPPWQRKVNHSPIKKQKVVRQVSILSISSTKSFYENKKDLYANQSQTYRKRTQQQIQQKKKEDFNNSHYNNKKYVDKNKIEDKSLIQQKNIADKKSQGDVFQLKLRQSRINGHSRLGIHGDKQIKRSKTQMKNKEIHPKQVRKHKNYFILADHFKQMSIQKQFKLINPQQVRKKLQNSYSKFKQQFVSPPQIKINPFRIPKVPIGPKGDQSLTEYIQCAKNLSRALDLKINEMSVLIRKYHNCITFKIQQDQDFVIWNFDGKLYVGGWKQLNEGDGIKQGFGLEFTSSYCYKGNFHSGKRSGHGIAQYYNGNVYEGFWQLGKMEGKGIYFDKNKSSYYDGDWEKGEQKGKGILKYSKKHYYVGEFANSEKCGKGTQFYENGDIYEGSYDKGMRNGNGIFYSHSGEAYAGNFKNSLKHGKGLLLTNKYSQTKHSIQQYYYGQFIEGTKSGYGIKRNLDGTYYYGYFYDNREHGPGFIQSSSFIQQKNQKIIQGKAEMTQINARKTTRMKSVINISGIWRNGELMVRNNNLLEGDESQHNQQF